MVYLICKTCKNSFNVFLSRKNTAKYCSRKCYILTDNKNPMFGKTHSKESIKKMTNHKNRQRFKNGILNPDYKHWNMSIKQMKQKFLKLYKQKKKDPEIAKILKISTSTICGWRREMKLNSNRVGERTIRKDLISKYKCCQICGFNNIKILQLHHIDKNRSNHSSSNFVIVCLNCHRLLHRGDIKYEA